MVDVWFRVLIFEFLGWLLFVLGFARLGGLLSSAAVPGFFRGFCLRGCVFVLLYAR